MSLCSWIRDAALSLRTAAAFGNAGKREPRRQRFVVDLEVLEQRTLLAGLYVRVDYTFDTNNFFNTQAKRDAIEAAAARYSALVTTELKACSASCSTADWRVGFPHPGTGSSFQLSTAPSASEDDLIGSGAADQYEFAGMAKNEWILFVGGRDMGSGGPAGIGATGTGINFTSTFDDIDGPMHRGIRDNRAGGDINDTVNDLPRWGGSVAFNSNVAWDWHFGISTSSAFGESDFYTIALHEIGHALGLSTDWNQVVQHIVRDLYQGPEAVAAFNADNNANVTRLRLASDADPHWLDDTYDSRIYEKGNPNYVGTVGAGNLQDLLMESVADYVFPDLRRFEVTNVDAGALRDIGWHTGLETKDKIGVRRGDTFYLDQNGNGRWESGLDQAIPFGLASDTPVTGDWNGDGWDDIGTRRSNTFYLDQNANGTWDTGVDRVISFGLASDTPIVGDWNGDGSDEIGVRRGDTFYLDQNGNGAWDPGLDQVLPFGLASDTPLVGDWDADGTDEIGVRRGDTFFMDQNGNGTWNPGVDRAIPFGLTSDTPVIGDWNGTGVDKVGVRRGDTFYLDQNGNGSWNPGTDQVISFGLTSDTSVVGNWRPKGEADEIAVRHGDTFYLDQDGNGVWDPEVDRAIPFGLASDTPIVGDWNGVGPDEIGVWRGGTFYLDQNGNGRWDPGVDRELPFGLAGTPLVGDWNGDGRDEIGVHGAGNFGFTLDQNGNGEWDGYDPHIGFGLSTDTPVIGDWNGDGKDEIGVRRGDKFYLDQNGDYLWELGIDRIILFGLASDIPIVGDWNGDGSDEIGVRRGDTFYLDQNGNGHWNGGVDRVIPFGLASDTPIIGNWQPSVAPLKAAGGVVHATAVRAQTSSDLNSIVDRAISLWTDSGLAAKQVAMLQTTEIRIADLSGAFLAVESNGIMTIDINASGHGWYVDVTPDDDEFGSLESDGAADRMDLLTVVLHEMGHLLGLLDTYDPADDDALMYGLLQTAVRRTVAK